MDLSPERLPEVGAPTFDAPVTASLLPLDPNESLDLHRAINERRAQIENPELLRHLRSL